MKKHFVETHWENGKDTAKMSYKYILVIVWLRAVSHTQNYTYPENTHTAYTDTQIHMHDHSHPNRRTQIVKLHIYFVCILYTVVHVCSVRMFSIQCLFCHTQFKIGRIQFSLDYTIFMVRNKFGLIENEFTSFIFISARYPY